jgi:hypothetical protein
MILDYRIGVREYKSHVTRNETGPWLAECLGRNLFAEGTTDEEAVHKLQVNLIASLEQEAREEGNIEGTSQPIYPYITLR